MINSLSNNLPIDDVKLETLRQFTASLVEKRGWVSEEDIETFFETGYTKRNILELIVGVGQKTISNYVNHIAHTPIDQQIK